MPSAEAAEDAVAEIARWLKPYAAHAVVAAGSERVCALVRFHQPKRATKVNVTASSRSQRSPPRLLRVRPPLRSAAVR
jgi:hypothetical protein